MRNACGKSCGVDIFGNKLPETLVAVVPLGWAYGLAGVAAPQDLEGDFVTPSACLGHCAEVDGYEVALGSTGPTPEK
ncbi:hypothetical protein [Corynebacterium sp. NML130628]|uniref:hypothetical protein n=1 Tax=Corynebacterium sp. NML130628 TaxID=1906333 RepID=UPI0015A71A11|nr:hypothetical protein [Corynebacterium sp. NML130628]